MLQERRKGPWHTGLAEGSKRGGCSYLPGGICKTKAQLDGWIRDKSSLELMDIQGIYGNQENGVCDRHKGGNKRKYCVGLLVF